MELCLTWFARHQELVAETQAQPGETSHYRRRREADSQLDPKRSLAEQINLLRVLDNNRYTALFE